MVFKPFPWRLELKVTSSVVYKALLAKRIVVGKDIAEVEKW